MAKPNKFIMNTDYLSIAQSGKYTNTYVVNGGTIPAGGQVIQEFDFSIPQQKGAIDQTMISMNSSEFKVGNRYGITINSEAGGWLSIQRTAPGTLHAELVLNNFFGSGPATYPAMVFTIRVSSFLPPNVF